MTGISPQAPDTERARLKQILKEVVPESAGVIVRTAAGGQRGGAARRRRAPHQDLGADQVQGRLQVRLEGQVRRRAGLVHGEPDLTVRVIRDVFNEDFTSLVVAGDQAWSEVSEYINDVAPTSPSG